MSEIQGGRLSVSKSVLLLTLSCWSESCGNAQATCRLAGNFVEGQLADLANTHFVPFAVGQLFL